MIIGTFKNAGDRFTGIIQTLTFTTEAVLAPARKKGDTSPDYRITTGATEIGVAWKETSEAGKSYLSVRLDDPSLPAPIACALVQSSIDQGYHLVWDRQRKRA